VLEAFDKLAEMPGMGAIREVRKARLKGLRSWPIRHFDNYLIFYLPLEQGGIDVLHILHGARDVDRIVERGIWLFNA
jgi:toxin ParE1/3/4